MITYKYKLYKSKQTKHLNAMLSEACFVWNHALSLQKRYYKLYHKYISDNRMRKHFAKRIHRHLLHSQTTQEIIDRLDIAYKRFFEHLSKRPPKFKKAKDFRSIVFRQGGYSLNGNVITINNIKKRFKFSLSRPYDGKVKTLTIKRSNTGDFYIFMVLEKVTETIRKTHNGASVGVDFGLKTYMTLSDGTTFYNPMFLKRGIYNLKQKSRSFSKCVQGSNKFERKRLELNRYYEKIVNKRNDWQWKLAHHLCHKYDKIFIENLQLNGMSTLWGRKIADLAHGEFIRKLQYVATKYGVTVHKIDRYYPSSKMCTCGYKYKGLQLCERTWTCPECGTVHKRDLLAANNILRQGIAELESVSKTRKSNIISAHMRSYPRISLIHE